jgi:protocatechuate 3,4-dioxygenase beta subunit
LPGPILSISVATKSGWRHPNRPAHLHFILKADGYQPLITHIFDPDDPYINSDAVFGVKKSLLAGLKRVNDPERARQLGFAGEFWEIEYNFVLAPAGNRMRLA